MVPMGSQSFDLGVLVLADEPAIRVMWANGSTDSPFSFRSSANPVKSG